VADASVIEREDEPAPVQAPGRMVAARSSRRWRSLRSRLFSSLTRRIVLFNLIALAVLLSGILYLNQFREGLIDARVESLLIQGRIIAGAIAASASVETDAITIDPEKLLELQTGETIAPQPDTLESLESPIKAEKIAPLLRTLIQPTITRARIYDRDGILVLDSRFLYGGGQVQRFDLSSDQQEREGMTALIGRLLSRALEWRSLPRYEELAGSGTQYPEVAKALIGGPSTVVRLTDKGELIVSVAVPVQRYRAVMGALLLSTQGGEIDRIVAQERIQILRIFLVAAIVITVLSVLMSISIANPLRKLADAAVRIRHGVKSRVEIPDLSTRGDEIGNLSQSLREMTTALYARIDAIESFAADVSHELKNPLTSLRSAVETLPLAKSEASRARLLEVIQHDVKRLDRLITDISDASRLDAELAREDSRALDLEKLVTNIIEMRRVVSPGHKQVALDLEVRRVLRETTPFKVLGHEGRVGQVLVNLLDNAWSFVPDGGAGKIGIRMFRDDRHIVIEVEDNGPGIRAENIERIFERFYTDRPEEGFGQNSGLGLSISRQIIEAHGGTLTAHNLSAPRHGAVFVMRLPAAGSKN
jgi:two-component system sensor histidine kinase ChvG